MKKFATRALVGGLIVIGLSLVACGGDSEEAAAVANSEAEAWIEETKASLDAKRAELAEARNAAAEAALVDDEAVSDDEASDDEASEGETDAADATDAAATESPADRVTALETEITSMSEGFITRVIEYINAQEILEGEPIPPEVQKAFRMKSDEDLIVAADWIERGGDYRRAIDIYTQQLALDPDYDKLKEAIASAEEMRYPNAERFAGVEKGMTEQEVRDILGPVNLRNIHPYPENDAVGWFYGKNPELGRRPPAAVYFQIKDDVYEVYKVEYGVADDEQPEQE